MPTVDMLGFRSGRLIVISRAENSADGKARWWCYCDCDKHKKRRKKIPVYGESLRAGPGRATVSCGCLRVERGIAAGKAKKGKRGKDADLVGKRFGKLVVIKRTKEIGLKQSQWVCKCLNCGRKKVFRSDWLLSKRRKISCGCLNTGHKRARAGKVHYIHGGTRKYFREYSSWVELNKRCYNPKVARFRYYGGRGIKVCDRWRFGEDGKHGFTCFLEDMGNRSKDMSIHRIDNDGDYCPENCKWADAIEQSRTRDLIRRARK